MKGGIDMDIRMAKFEKISYEQFVKDIPSYVKDRDPKWLEYLYDEIRLPERATIGSAGYDFFFPYDTISLASGCSIVIPTGIKCYMESGWWLGLFPKSKFGINYRLKLDDTVSVIDNDYYNCKDNEGHIFVKMTNNDVQKRVIYINHEAAFCQGVFMIHGLTYNDNATGIRTGGLGSTNT